MALALVKKQWMWLTDTLEELDLPVSNVTIFGDNKATIDIAYLHKIGDRS
jgi:hypothetical protein